MPVTVSCRIQVDIIVVMAVPAKKPCATVSSGGTLMVICGELPPLKDLAISAKPGGGICLGVMGLSGGFSPIGWKCLRYQVSGWKQLRCSPLWWWGALSILYCGSQKKNPEGRLSCTYCSFVPTWYQVPLVWRVEKKSPSPNAMMVLWQGLPHWWTTSAVPLILSTLSHMLPPGMVSQPRAVGLFLPRIARPLHRLVSSGAV